MPWLDTTNKTFSLLLKIVLLIILILGVSFLGLSIFGNVIGSDDTPKLPDADKARYQFLIKNTGEYIFTDDYSTDGGIYVLHGYYELKDGKYRWHDKDLSLNPEYFGLIQVRKR